MTIRKMTPEELAAFQARCEQQKQWSRREARRRGTRNLIIIAAFLAAFVALHYLHVRF